MQRISWILLALVLIGLPLEPVLANKFVTISGGVGGVSSEKLRTLKEIALIAGAVLALIGILGLLTRGRFEGLIGLANPKQVFSAAVALIALGGVLVVISLI